ARHADASEHTRRQHRIGIGEHGTAADRARRSVDHVVDEIHIAAVFEVLLVEQLSATTTPPSRPVTSLPLPEKRSYRRYEASSMVNSKRIGSSETMVASIVVVPPEPPVTRLPRETRRSPIRPVMGARNSVNSRSSSAWRTAASLAATEAVAARKAWVR